MRRGRAVRNIRRRLRHLRQRSVWRWRRELSCRLLVPKRLRTQLLRPLLRQLWLRNGRHARLLGGRFAKLGQSWLRLLPRRLRRTRPQWLLCPLRPGRPRLPVQLGRSKLQLRTGTACGANSLSVLHGPRPTRFPVGEPAEDWAVLIGRDEPERSFAEVRRRK
jgi:hypothetical protein